MNQLQNEVLKLSLQLIILGIAGGFISFYYSKLQKNREIIINLMKETSTIQSHFLSLRYKYNTFFTEAGRSTSDNLDEDFKKKLKWEYYEEACELIGTFQSIKPLLVKFFPHCKPEIEDLHSKYQFWRRYIRADEPIYQNSQGKTRDELDTIKAKYSNLIESMKELI